MSSRRRLLLPACLGVLYVVWGSTYLAQRIAVAEMPPLQMVAVRFLISGALLYAGLRAAGARPPARREWTAAAVSAVPLMVTGMGAAAVALTRVPSGLAALVFGSVPLWTALDRSTARLVGAGRIPAGDLIAELDATDPAGKDT